MERTGQLNAGAVAEQFERMMQQLHCLSVAEAIVSCRGVRQSLAVRIATVQEWWDTELKKFRAIDRLRDRLWELRPYYFVPGESPGEPQSVTSNGHPRALPVKRLRNRTQEMPAEEIPFEE